MPAAGRKMCAYDSRKRGGKELLRFRKIRGGALRQRHVEDVEDHRDPGVVAEDPDQLDGAAIAEDGVDALVGALAYPPRLVELLDEIENRALVFGGLLGGAAGLEVADGLCLHAGLFGDRRVGVPFVLRAPYPC